MQLLVSLYFFQDNVFRNFIRVHVPILLDKDAQVESTFLLLVMPRGIRLCSLFFFLSLKQQHFTLLVFELQITFRSTYSSCPYFEFPFLTLFSRDKKFAKLRSSFFSYTKIYLHKSEQLENSKFRTLLSLCLL